MNRKEVLLFLKTFFARLTFPGGEEAVEKLEPFLSIVASLKKDLPLSVPLLREFAAGFTKPQGGPLYGRLNRRYLRLCRLQEELSSLDLKKAAPGVSPEDFIFSRIRFSRYREIGEKTFDLFFLEGLADFGEGFFKNNFGLARDAAAALIAGSYENSGGVRGLRKESPLVLSLMRTLETSIDTLPLLSAAEIAEELGNLMNFLEGREELAPDKGKPLPGSEKLFPLLVLSLDGTELAHEDGSVTSLFISPEKNLSGTFRPGNKPWTLVLVPAGAAEIPEESPAPRQAKFSFR